MKRSGKVVAVVAALIVATSAVGCGGDSAATVTNDVSKDPKLLDAMGAYMKNRPGAKQAAKQSAKKAAH